MNQRINSEESISYIAAIVAAYKKDLNSKIEFDFLGDTDKKEKQRRHDILLFKTLNTGELLEEFIYSGAPILRETLSSFNETRREFIWSVLAKMLDENLPHESLIYYNPPKLMDIKGMARISYSTTSTDAFIEIPAAQVSILETTGQQINLIDTIEKLRKTKIDLLALQLTTLL